VFLLAVVFGLAFLDSSLGAATRPVSAAVVTLDVVFGGIGCLLLWLRRRWPVGVAIAMMPIVAVSAFSTVAAGTVALFDPVILVPEISGCTPIRWA